MILFVCLLAWQLEYIAGMARNGGKSSPGDTCLRGNPGMTLKS